MENPVRNPIHHCLKSPAARSFILFILLLLLHLGLFEYLIQHTDIVFPLQLLETQIISSVQTFAGVDVVAVEDMLYYPSHDLHLIVGPVCTGIREMLLFAIVVIPFGALTFRKKLKSLAFFLPVILVENLARISLLYPVASSYGVRTMDLSHDIIWGYGQLAFLILLLLVWFYYFSGLRPAGVKEKRNGGEGDDCKDA